MKAVILAAGVGTRLRPLTDACPKPVLPIAGRPLLARTLDWLRAQGVGEVALNLHHLPDRVRDCLGDGAAWGMRLRYSYEPVLLGTAGAVRAIDQRFPGWLDQPFLVVYGDMLVDIDLQDLLDFHRAKRALFTMALKHTAHPVSQGMVELEASGRVVRFVEKPPLWDRGDLANAGLYLCEPPLLSWLLDGPSDFGCDLIPALVAADAPVYARLARGYLLDIGTPAAYAQAQQDWAGR